MKVPTCSSEVSVLVEIQNISTENDWSSLTSTRHRVVLTRNHNV